MRQFADDLEGKTPTHPDAPRNPAPKSAPAPTPAAPQPEPESSSPPPSEPINKTSENIDGTCKFNSFLFNILPTETTIVGLGSGGGGWLRWLGRLAGRT